jgi:dihydroorotase
MTRLYRNASIASADSTSLLSADVLIRDTQIIAVEQNIPSADAEVIDCSGQILLPALFDLHVHAREPGRDEREDIQSCSEAAINGGFTGMVLMPNTTPAIDSGAAVQNILDIIREKSRIAPTVFTAGAITKGRKGEELAGIAGMHARGAVLLTDDHASISNSQVLRRAMEYLKPYGLPIASHCEVKELSAKGCMHEGSVSYSLGLPGLPAISEEICIARDIRLAEYIGVPLHIQTVSTAHGMETIRRAKDRGLRITCEVTPHHLILDHHSIGAYDTRFKMNPPLRTQQDRSALLQGLIDGVFDFIATDHAPLTEFEKNQDFASAPFGITGLETALPALHHHFLRHGTLSWQHIVRHLSTQPRRFLGLPDSEIKPGNTADLIVFDPARTSTFTPSFMRSKSQNTPFLNQTLQGLVTHVFYRGQTLLQR